ncbi:MAG: hypothetical protein ABSF77_14035 [Spirochaetia bacterium]|jgi:hypothetical protein
MVTKLLHEIVNGYSRWVGFGWSLAFLIWFAGALFILTVIYRFFMERVGSRLPTAVVFFIWTVVVLGVAARYLGFGPPGG